MPGIKKTHLAYSAKSPVEGETNDCHVRALALVLGISYQESHKLHEELGRKPGTPTTYGICNELVKRFGMKRIDIWRKGESFKARYPTVKQFVWDHPKGKYLVHRNGHAFAIIDGIVHDWQYGTGPRSRVVFAAKLED
jgi:hypothetical protein